MHRQNFFFIRENRKFVKIETASIQYIESQRNYSKIYTATRSYMVGASLKELEDLLPAADFCRIHRSYIINLAWLSSFDTDKAILAGHSLSIGESYRKALGAKVLIVGSVNKHELAVQ